MLMVRELSAGGTERQLTEMARSLDPARFKVHVGCFHYGVRETELRAANIPILRLPITSFIKPNALRGALQLIRYLRRHKIKIVHTFDYPLNCFGVPLARAARVPVVLSSQRAHRELTPPAYLKLLRFTDRLVNGVVVNCGAMQREMIDREHVAAARVHLCYNGIDTARLNPNGRARLPIVSDAELVIGVVAVLRPEKSIHTLLEAFAKASSNQSAIKLLIVGSGPELPKLRDLAERLSISRRCVFQPAVGDVAPWFRSIDIFVLPSLSEALSNSLMEAMACGCACVASNTGGNPELIQNAASGLLFNCGDADDLAQKLGLLIVNSALRFSLASSSSQLIAEKFSLSAAALRLENIYQAYL